MRVAGVGLDTAGGRVVAPSILDGSRVEMARADRQSWSSSHCAWWRQTRFIWTGALLSPGQVAGRLVDVNNCLLVTRGNDHDIDRFSGARRTHNDKPVLECCAARR